MTGSIRAVDSSAVSQVSNEDVRRSYERDGYVVVRQLVPPPIVAAARAAIDAELRGSRAHFWRQTTGRPERHAEDLHGRLGPPIQNLQDLRAADFPRLRRSVLELYSLDAVQDVLRSLFDEEPVLVQSMLFEANPATPAHQDCYYLDSTREGSLLGAWFALEDIPREAGRFYACPGSHRSEIARNAGPFRGPAHHDRYLARVQEAISKEEWTRHAPALQAGDALFWSSRTVHGSLPTEDESLTRLSLTAHYMPASTGFLTTQSRVVPLNLETVNGLGIHRSRPQELLKWRAVTQLSARAPGLLKLARRAWSRLKSR